MYAGLATWCPASGSIRRREGKEDDGRWTTDNGHAAFSITNWTNKTNETNTNYLTILDGTRTPTPPARAGENAEELKIQLGEMELPCFSLTQNTDELPGDEQLSLYSDLLVEILAF
jgi:hypothetical protein